VQAEAATAHRVREAAEAERKRAEADLETFINTRSRLENELAEAEQQKIKMEKSLSERKQDGGAAASKDEKVFPTPVFSIWLYHAVHRNKLRRQLKGCRLCARR
jgi:hypothetical protein